MPESPLEVLQRKILEIETKEGRTHKANQACRWAATDALGAGAEEFEAGGKNAFKSNASKIGHEFPQEPGQVRKKQHNSLRAWQVQPS